MNFYDQEGITQTLSAPRTPQQNGVFERKYRILVEVARTILDDAKLPTYFWTEVVNTTCYTQNISVINKAKGKTPYPLMKEDKKPNIVDFLSAANALY